MKPYHRYRVGGRKLWHGTPGGVKVSDSGDHRGDPPGRQLKNPAVIRKLAIEHARDSKCPMFKCLRCGEPFPLDYGRYARDHWPHEYELTCLDCIKVHRLDKDTRTMKRR